MLGHSFSTGAQKRLAALIERPCLVVVDEVHHAVSPTYEKMLDFITRRCPSVVLVGLTATPWPSGQGMTRRLIERFPQKVIEVQVRDMVRAGVLARPMTHTIDTHQFVTLSPPEVAQLGGGDLPPSVLRRLDDEVRNRIIVNTWVARHEQWGKTLVFACDIEHADRLHAMFLDNSVRSQVVHSRSDEEQRKVLQEFREGSEPRVLISVGMLLEGVDVPDARTAFLTPPTRSRILMRQMIGRVLRGPDAGGEEIAHIVDLRDRWSDDVDVLAPVDIPGVDHIPTRTEDTQERQLPRILDEDSDTPIPEDVVRRIEREYSVLIKAVPYAPALTFTELVGFYELGHLNVPIFAHVRERWEELIRSAITERWSVHSAMELFNDLPTPRPSRQDIDEIVAHCRSAQVAPALVPNRTGLSTRRLAEELVGGDAIGEREKVTWLRERYEASLARAAYESFQGFFEAVQAEILAFTLDARASDPESPHAHESRACLPKLMRSTARSLEPLLSQTVVIGSELLAAEQKPYRDLLAKPNLPRVQWTRTPVRSTWGYWTTQMYGQRIGTPQIFINRQLQAPKTQVPDELLRYLLWHELCHHVLPGRGHDAEFRRLEALWPDSARLDHELDTMQERFDLGWLPATTARAL